MQHSFIRFIMSSNINMSFTKLNQAEILELFDFDSDAYLKPEEVQTGTEECKSDFIDLTVENELTAVPFQEPFLVEDIFAEERVLFNYVEPAPLPPLEFLPDRELARLWLAAYQARALRDPAPEVKPKRNSKKK